jgi:SnoaL-like domain
MSNDLESRVRQLEDRALISEVVIKYALGVDRRDWEMFASCFTDPVYTDFSRTPNTSSTILRAATSTSPAAPTPTTCGARPTAGVSSA